MGTSKCDFRRVRRNGRGGVGVKDELMEWVRHFNIHRAAFQKVLVDVATRAGVEIIVNARVLTIDESGIYPVAITKDGRKFEADLIIAADGTNLSPNSWT